MRRTRAITTTLLLSAIGLSAAPGCNIVAPAYMAIHGPDKVQPRFNLDAEALTVVLIDDPANTTSRRQTRIVIAEAATEQLGNKRVLTRRLDPQAAITIVSKDSYAEPLSIVEIGKAVQADVVIYAALTKFTLTTDGGVMMPTCEMSVKVIDVRSGARVWPDRREGMFIRVGNEYRPGTLPTTSGAMLQAEQELAARAGLGIAQLFYKHELPQSVLR